MANKKSAEDDDEDVEVIQDDEKDVGQDNFDWCFSRIPEGFDINDVENSAKFVVLMDIIMHCRNRGERLVVFSSSLVALNLLEKVLENWHECRREMLRFVDFICFIVRCLIRRIKLSQRFCLNYV